MSNQNNEREHRDGSDFDIAEAGKKRRQRGENEGEQPAEGEVAHDGEAGQENDYQQQCQEWVESEDCAERRGDAFSTLKTELDRPGMARDDRSQWRRPRTRVPLKPNTSKGDEPSARRTNVRARADQRVCV